MFDLSIFNLSVVKLVIQRAALVDIYIYKKKEKGLTCAKFDLRIFDLSIFDCIAMCLEKFMGPQVPWAVIQFKEHKLALFFFILFKVY